MSSRQKSPAIGIDLGTTFSCVAVFQNGKVEIIQHHETGNRITPSYVAFTESEILVGDPAKDENIYNPEGTIYDIKRLIGRRYSDPRVQESLKRWPFTILNDENAPKIQVNYENKTKIFDPEELSAMVLKKMKEVAERYLGETVHNAVVTVPAYFDGLQRQATIDACTIAGLNVLKLAAEPTSAAVAYGLDKNVKEEKNILIYDLGGGTFDVSILTIKRGLEIVVKALDGDTHLGGEDFDNKLVDHMSREFERKFKINFQGNKRALCRLKKACERAKISLSCVKEAKVEYTHQERDLYVIISRAKFEDLCLDLFKKTLKHVEQALAKAKLQKSQIQNIILVGGSTRIPKVQNLLKNFFGRKELTCSINPDEAVAYGAAVQAAKLNGDESNTIKDMIVVDVTPLSLGTALDCGLMSVIIKRNTRIPARVSKTFRTAEDNQDAVRFEVYEGERARGEDNHFLGKLIIEGIPPAPRGVPKITVTFILDENGVLKVIAHIDSTGKEESIRITLDKGRLTTEEIQRKVAEAERYHEADRVHRECAASRQMLEDYAFEVKHAMDEETANKCNEVLEWLQNNPRAQKTEFDDQLKKLKAVSNTRRGKIAILQPTCL